MTDTVELSRQTPETVQPFAALGLTADEYAKIVSTLGRRPTETELAMYSIMWSEHCSYKSSKVHLRQFASKAPQSKALLVGMGENAGVVDVGDGLAVTFKVESHNHPSYIEPYQGAATGVGGIIRDILTMGARPIAVMDSLRFGAPEHPDTRRVASGVVAGIGGYGNCVGIPNIGGQVAFDASYQGNPLVNALCVGVMPISRIQKSAASGVGNLVVLLGAKTGRDGIGGVSVLASASFEDSDREAARPSVQVGDPFYKKLLIECCLELFDADVVVGIQDLGGAGLTCATSETAAAGKSGMRINLNSVPLREDMMAPHEIMASESQERMLAIVHPSDIARVMAIAGKWGVLATNIGEIVEGDRLHVFWNEKLIVDVPPASLADEGPVYERPFAEPAGLMALREDSAAKLARPHGGAAIRETLLKLLAHPSHADSTPITEQYDRYVLGNTILARPEATGVIRLNEKTNRGITIALAGNARFAALDPYVGAQLALAEAYRAVAAAGAQPLAVTNCLNFGSPEDSGVMWQFAEAVRGLADACQKLGTPVTGGNVSFYNQTGTEAIHPTPVIGVVGVMDNVRRRVGLGFQPGQSLLLLSGNPENSRDELSGSAWAQVMHGHLGGSPPAVDLAAEARLGQLLCDGARQELTTSAQSLAAGGLAKALVTGCLRNGVGVDVSLGGDIFTGLFSEESMRAIVTVEAENLEPFVNLAQQQGIRVEQIGHTGGKNLSVTGPDQEDDFSVSLNEVAAAHRAPLPV